MEQSEIISRIDTFLALDGASTNSFSRSAGIDPGNMTKMLAGKQKITDNTLRKISSATGLSFDWLKYGEGDMYQKESSAPEINYTDGVPSYNEDFLIGFDEVMAPSSESPDYLIRMPKYQKATLWCNASGHSMEPEINNGDIIALQRVEDFSYLTYGDVYGIITTNGLRTIKRLGRSDKEGYYRLIPTNKDYDAQDIPVNRIAIVYRVMGAITMKTF